MKKLNILLTTLISTSAINCSGQALITATLLTSLPKSTSAQATACQPNLYKKQTLHLPPTNTYKGPNAAPSYPGVRVTTNEKFPTSKSGKNHTVRHT